MASINFNQSAVVALDTLRTITADLQRTQNIISTGKSVANARDNAAVWAISTVMESDVSSFQAIKNSLNLGAATVGVARSAAEEVTSLLNEMKTLIVSAQEDNVDRAKIDTDVQALKAQITSIVDAAQFNGQNLLKGTANVNILSSLDRDGVSDPVASYISISRQSLESGTYVAGATGASAINKLVLTAGTDDSTPATTGTTADEQVYVLGTADANVDAGTGVDLTIGSAETIAAGDSFQITFTQGGVDYTAEYVASASSTENDVIKSLSDQLIASGANISTTLTLPTDTANDDSVLRITNEDASAELVNFTVRQSNNAAAGPTGGLAGLATLQVDSTANATAALSTIEGLIQKSIDASAAFGSAQNRIDIQNNFVQSLIDSLDAGISALTDANLEEASARLQSLQVQQQLNIQSLTIANQSPQVILALFQ